MTHNILITGCSSGIGLAAAKLLHSSGYQVFATARKTQDLQKLQSAGFSAIPLDINNSNSIKTAIDTVFNQTQNKLYALINNAGYQQLGAVEDLTREAVQMQFDTNFFGLLELTNYVIPLMRQQGLGRIINISSILGLVSLPYRGAYNASKFALEGLTDALRQELHGSGIEVSLVEPGPISTQINANREQYPQDYLHNLSGTHHAKYQALLKQKKAPFTLAPEAVAKKILAALKSSKPKARYYVTVPVYVLTFLKKLLPTRMLDWILRKI